MYQKNIQVALPHGLHIRPAALLVKEAKKQSAPVTLTLLGQTVDAKSLLALQTLEIVEGSWVELKVEGESAEQVGEAMRSILEHQSAVI